jgi:hypothetical protein
MFERTLDHQHDRKEAPQQSPSMHQTPFYVLPTLGHNNLLTLPGGELISGLRNAVTSHERNAIHIARMHDLAVKGRGSLMLPKEEKLDGYGFVVEPAWKTAVPEYADFTKNSQIGQHNKPLELHNYHEILEQLDDTPEHHNRIVLIRAFGDFVLTHGS